MPPTGNHHPDGLCVGLSGWWRTVSATALDAHEIASPMVVNRTATRADARPFSVRLVERYLDVRNDGHHRVTDFAGGNLREFRTLALIGIPMVRTQSAKGRCPDGGG
jgi:hypothetical protein